MFFYHFGIAQLHIAKDNINCLYGLKDESRSWVVQPKYIYINECSGSFVVFDGLNHGVVSKNGKLIIPIQHESIFCEFNYFLGYNKSKIKIYDKTGKALSKQVYDEVKRYGFSGDWLWCYKIFSDSILTSLLNLKSGFLFKDINGFVHEWADSTYTIIQTYRDRYSKCGVLDTNGICVIPKKYNEIEVKKKYFLAKKQDTVVFLNHKNELIFEPFATIKRAYKNRAELYLLTKHDSASGIIDDKLKVIIPFNKYDKINFIRDGKYWYGMDYLKNNNIVFIVTKNNKTGIVDSLGNEIIPLLYDELKPIYANDSCIKYVYKQNDKYGILNETGTIALNAEYDLPIIDSRYNSDKNRVFYLVNKKEAYFVNDSCELSKLNFLFENKFGSIYSNKYRIAYIKQNTQTNKYILFWNSDTLKVARDNNWIKNRFIKISSKTKTGNWILNVYDNQGKEIFADRLQQFDTWKRQFDDEYFVATRSHHQGVYSVKTGNFIIDTLYSKIISPFWHENKNLYLGKLSAEKGYHAFDTLGKKYIPDILDTIIVNQTCDYNFLVAYTFGKMGVIGSNQKWLIQPNYRYIRPLTENYFLIITPNKKVGVVDIHNKLIIDTVYTDFLPVFSNFSCELFEANDAINGFTADKKEQWWLFKNKEKRILFSNNNETVSDNNSKIIDSLLFKFAFNGGDFFRMNGVWHYDLIKADGSHNIAEGAFTIIRYNDKDLLLNKPYIKELYHILEQSYLSQIKIFKNHYTSYNNPMLGFTTDNHTILDSIYNKSLYDFGNNFVSLNSNSYNLRKDSSFYEPTYNSFSFENYIFKNSSLNKISLLDIFGNSNNLLKELLWAITKQEGLMLYCSSTEGYLENLRGRFSLSDKGISLYLDDEHASVNALLISKDRLMANEYAKWIVPYLN